MINIEINKDNVKRCNKVWGRDAQLFIAVEELSELIQSVSKARREKKNYRENLVEEIADSYIAIEILKDQFDISDEEIEHIVKYKQQRLERKMDIQFLSNGFSSNEMDDTIIAPNTIDANKSLGGCLLPWYVRIHDYSDREDYYLNVKAFSEVRLSMLRDKTTNEPLLITMFIRIGEESREREIMHDDIFAVLAKMDRYTDYNVVPLVEDLFFDGPKEYREDYNFKTLYKKYHLDERERLFPDGIK